MIKVGETGVTRYVDTLIEYIEENPNEFIGIARINDGDKNYTFIALFKDKCTIGKFSALVHEWGTNDGMSGEGGKGFVRMNSYIDKKNVEVEDYTLSEEDAKKIGYKTSSRFSRVTEWDQRKKIWQKYADMLKNYLV